MKNFIFKAAELEQRVKFLEAELLAAQRSATMSKQVRDSRSRLRRCGKAGAGAPESALRPPGDIRAGGGGGAPFTSSRARVVDGAR